MIAMSQTEYQNIAKESLKDLREEMPNTKIELKQKKIQTR